MASVEIRNAVKTFGAMEVLHGVSVDIQDQEFVVLVGPSGCGKSTLLRMIAGLEEISKGEILIGGRQVNGLPPKQRDVAMVFQNYALYPHMKVFDNMAFSLKLAKAPKEVMQAQVNRAAEILDLTNLLGRYPRQLSGGQRQRVAMGRAIVRDPKVFLFDEPLSNLDAKLRVQMRAEIKSLQNKLGTTTIYVTHDQVEAMTMADRIVVMNNGFVEQIGHPIDLYDRPANVFVAGFLGSPAMNFVPGCLMRDEKNGKAWVEAAGGVRLPLGPNARGEQGRNVVYGIRPKSFTLAEPGAENGIELTIGVVQPTGDEIEVVTSIAGEPAIIVFTDRANFEPEQRITVCPMLDAVHLFDAETGTRISD